ncbi:MAG: 30S ribosomal protein S20 [Elusimicrobiaceae bacterium]|nr:30S ribosomal protein S20 [Elusimicrobiaceae bacterium]
MAKLKTGRHTSGIKAHRQSERRAAFNRGMRKMIRTAAKAVTTAVEKKEPETGKVLTEAFSKWDKAAKKGLIHWKTAARKKSRLSKLTASSSK